MNKYNVSINDLRPIITREEIPVLFKKMDAKIICEIGVRYGEYLTTLLTPEIERVVAVDIWREVGVVSQNDVCYPQDQLDAQYNTILEWSKRDPRIQVERDFSVNVANKFDDEYFDFVYIDADHTEAAVWADIQAWWPKVRKGGVLAGHDYSPAIVKTGGVILKFGVIEAVNRFVATNKLLLHIDRNQSWFIPKN